MLHILYNVFTQCVCIQFSEKLNQEEGDSRVPLSPEPRRYVRLVPAGLTRLFHFFTKFLHVLNIFSLFSIFASEDVGEFKLVIVSLEESTI